MDGGLSGKLPFHRDGHQLLDRTGAAVPATEFLVPCGRRAILPGVSSVFRLFGAAARQGVASSQTCRRPDGRDRHLVCHLSCSNKYKRNRGLLLAVRQSMGTRARGFDRCGHELAPPDTQVCCRNHDLGWLGSDRLLGRRLWCQYVISRNGGRGASSRGWIGDCRRHRRSTLGCGITSGTTAVPMDGSALLLAVLVALADPSIIAAGSLGKAHLSFSQNVVWACSWRSERLSFPTDSWRIRCDTPDPGSRIGTIAVGALLITLSVVVANDRTQ